jgi:hypothetical protein
MGKAGHGGSRRGAGRPRGIPNPNAGRKRSPLGERPATPVGFRPNELERAAIEQRCAELGLTISTWLRALVKKELDLE